MLVCQQISLPGNMGHVTGQSFFDPTQYKYTPENTAFPKWEIDHKNGQNDTF